MAMSCCVMAQDIAVKDFVGVWNSTKEDTYNKAIRVAEIQGELSVQMRTSTGLQKGKNVDVKNNTLYWRIDEDTEYGKWWIGSWNGEREHILVGKGYSHGTNGPVTGYYEGYHRDRYSNNIANREYNYTEYKAELDSDGIKVYRKCVSDYYKGTTPMFYQSSSWFFAGEYINW